MSERIEVGREIQVCGAIVFDCDGLLLDTEACWVRAEASIFAEYGRKHTPEVRHLLMGTSTQTAGEIIAQLLHRPGLGSLLGARLLERAWEEVVAGAKPRPGVLELVEAAHDCVPLGVASNSPRDLVEAALDAAGLAGVFRTIVGADAVPSPKPAPDVYLTACKRLGASAEGSVAFEDSPIGVTAAQAAGLYVVGVPSRPGVTLDAHQVVDSLAHPAAHAALARVKTLKTEHARASDTCP